LMDEITVEDTIQNGLKETKHNPFEDGLAMEEAIQNGIKEIKGISDFLLSSEILEVNSKKTIRDGVKLTHLGGKDRKIDEIKDIVENGVKETKMEEHHRLREVVQTVKNGIKETTPGGYLGSVEMKGKTVHQFEHSKENNEVEGVIENGVKETKGSIFDNPTEVKNTIQNGIRHVEIGWAQDNNVEDVIKGGIKNTINHPARPQEVVDNTIKNGIKETKQEPSQRTWMSEEVINNGIKETKKGGFNQHYDMFGTIENGIKDTVCGVLEIYNPIHFEPELSEMKRMNEVNIVLENGIKETKTPNHHNAVNAFDFLKYNGADSHHELIDRVIQNGIKEVKELPDKSGMLLGYGEYYARREDKTYPHTDIVNDVIRNGIKETKYCELHSAMSAEHIIRDGIKETWGYAQQPQIRVNEVINVGIKETNWRRVDNHPTFLDNIIKSNN
jgi:hypothetical protein